MKQKKSKTLNKEPYLLHEASKNKDIAYYTPSCCSYVFQTYQGKIIKEGKETKSFGFDSLYKLKDEYTFDHISKALDSHIQNSKSGQEFSKKDGTYRSMLKSYLGGWYKLSIFFSVLSSLFTVPIPLFIKFFIEWLEDEGSEMATGYYLFFAILGSFTLGRIFSFISRNGKYKGQILAKTVTEVNDLNYFLGFCCEEDYKFTSWSIEICRFW